MEIKYIINKENMTLRDFLSEKGFSRTFLKKIRLKDLAYVRGKVVKNHDILIMGEELIINLEEEINPYFILNNTKLDILYEDDYFLIINKKAGLASQPSKRHPSDNIISMVAAYYHEKNIKANIHVVTRLDFATTGILIIAKSGLLHQLISKSEISKKYICKIKSSLNPQEGTINLPIKRVKPYDIRRWVSDEGSFAITEYKTLASYDDYSYVEAKLITGRTHQIRIHMAYLNCPIYGENLYDNQKPPLHLHCSEISFIHPITNKKILIKSKPEWLLI